MPHVTASRREQRRRPRCWAEVLQDECSICSTGKSSEWPKESSTISHALSCYLGHLSQRTSVLPQVQPSHTGLLPIPELPQATLWLSLSALLSSPRPCAPPPPRVTWRLCLPLKSLHQCSFSKRPISFPLFKTAIGPPGSIALRTLLILPKFFIIIIF